MNEYNEKNRAILKEVLEEIKEQFLIAGGSRQFLFYSERVSERKLTEPIIHKWLQVLSNKGVLHFYKPVNYEMEQSAALERRCLLETYNWTPQTTTLFALGPAPSFVIDICETDLNQLIRLISKERLWESFYKDKLDRFYYDDKPLTKINSSKTYKLILGELLIADEHTLTAKEVMELLSDDDIQKRNRVVSDIRKSLRSASREINIESHKTGRSVDYYRLTIRQ